MDAAIARWKCPGDLTAVGTDVVVRLLTSVYGFDDSAIRSAFTKMLGLENIQIEDDQSVEDVRPATDSTLAPCRHSEGL
jgi:hypothetical protein